MVLPEWSQVHPVKLCHFPLEKNINRAKETFDIVYNTSIVCDVFNTWYPAYISSYSVISPLGSSGGIQDTSTVLSPTLTTVTLVG